MEYDFAVLDNAEQPRSIVYNIDTGEEVATYSITLPEQIKAEEHAARLNGGNFDF